MKEIGYFVLMKFFLSIVYSLCSVCWYILFGGKLDLGVMVNCDSCF